MAIAGPGAQPQVKEDVRPLLEGASEYEFVTILNPLTDDFAIRVAQDVPVNMPVKIRNPSTLIQTENDIVRNYGIALKGKDFQAKKHIVNDTIIKAGHTINLKGNEAQVAVRQLTNEILQREGNSRLLVDPQLRHEVEQRIIIARGSVQDLMDNNLQTPRNQIDAAINRSNEANNERAFPGIDNNGTDQTIEASGNASDGDSTPQHRSPGRPRKN